jgi:uncharacterized protein YjbI with pentapeptide repeats
MTDDVTSPPSSPGDLAAPPSATAAQRARLRELSAKTMWLTAVVIAVLTVGAVVVLWWPATAGLNGADLVSARLDALKVGLSVAVGSGGVVALYLSWRRQHSTEADLDNRERALTHQQHDSAERRLTELYLKAVEQLGSPQAAVRHGGLYALERVAQDNPRQRQTVVNVICAYLRNPYAPPPEAGQLRPLGIRRPLLRSATAARSAPTPSREVLLQEREVRLTAQRILQLHLHPGADLDHPQPGFWRDIDLDLTGATLINFSLRGCAVATATFDQAIFTGDASFDGVTFNGRAGFIGATFTGDAGFSGVTFTGDAGFSGVTFTGDAGFSGVTFTGGAGFDRARFAGFAGFDGVTFTGRAWFDRAAFSGYTRFDGATFDGDAWFDRATFSGRTSFAHATFISGAQFTWTTFSGVAGETFRSGGDSFDWATRKGLPFNPTTHGASSPHEAPPGSEGGTP